MGNGEEPIRVLLLGPDPPRLSMPGVEPLWVPLVRVSRVPGASSQLVETAERISADTLVFTSPRAPRLLREDAAETGTLERLSSLLRRLTVWAIGPRTAGAVRLHLSVDPRVPLEYRGVALASEIAGSGSRSVVGARGSRALPDLAVELGRSGVLYEEVTVYIVEPESSPDRLRLAKDAASRAHMVVLTSPLIARIYASIAPRPGPPVVAIGPTTMRSALEAGLRVLCYPDRYTVEHAVACGLEKLGARNV